MFQIATSPSAGNLSRYVGEIKVNELYDLSKVVKQHKVSFPQRHAAVAGDFRKLISPHVPEISLAAAKLKLSGQELERQLDF